MVPEHYLKYLHPHEHHDCAGSCGLDHDSLIAREHNCNQEKDYFFAPPVEPLVLVFQWVFIRETYCAGLPRLAYLFTLPSSGRSPPTFI